MAGARIQKFLDAARLMRCPLCGAPFTPADPSLVCAHGHRFDISAKGFVTTVSNCAPLKGYDAGFFESRRRIMDAGYYDAIVEALVDALGSLPATAVLVDAGCGEGHYAKSLQTSFGCRVAALDYSKDAIRCAARGANDVLWFVADVANIPLSDASSDALIDVFTPANYAEFSRVLKPGGVLIKVIPAARHMHEIRELVGLSGSEDDFSNQRVIDHFAEFFPSFERRRVTSVHAVRAGHAADLVRMSPVSFGVDPATLALDRLGSITVDAELLIARR